MKENILADTTRYKDFKPTGGGGAQEKSSSKIPVLKGKLPNSKTTTQNKASKSSESNIPPSINLETSNTKPKNHETTEEQNIDEVDNKQAAASKDLTADKKCNNNAIIVDANHAAAKKESEVIVITTTTTTPKKNEKKNENSTTDNSKSKDSSSRKSNNRKSNVDIVVSNVVNTPMEDSTKPPTMIHKVENGCSKEEVLEQGNEDRNTNFCQQNIPEDVKSNLQQMKRKISNLHEVVDTDIKLEKETIYCLPDTIPCAHSDSKTVETDRNIKQHQLNPSLVLTQEQNKVITKKETSSTQEKVSTNVVDSKKKSPKGSSVVVDFKNLTKVDQNNKQNPTVDKIAATSTSMQNKAESVTLTVSPSKTSNPANGNIHRTSSFSFLNTKLLTTTTTTVETVVNNIEEPSIEAQHLSDENETSFKLSRLALKEGNYNNDNKLFGVGVKQQNGTPPIACRETATNELDSDSLEAEHILTALPIKENGNRKDKTLRRPESVENRKTMEISTTSEDQNNKAQQQTLEIDKPKILPKTPASTTTPAASVQTKCFFGDDDEEFDDRDYFDYNKPVKTTQKQHHSNIELKTTVVPDDDDDDDDDKNKLSIAAAEHQVDKEEDYFDHGIVDTIYSDERILDAVHSSGYLSQTSTSRETVNRGEHHYEPVIISGAKHDSKRHSAITNDKPQKYNQQLSAPYFAGSQSQTGINNPPQTSPSVVTNDRQSPLVESSFYPRNHSLPPKYLPPTPSSSSTTPPTTSKPSKVQQQQQYQVGNEEGKGVKPAKESRTVFNVLSNIVDDLKYRIQSKKSIRRHGSSVDLRSAGKNNNTSNSGGGVSSKKKNRMYRSLSMDCLDIDGEIGVVRSSSTSNNKHIHHHVNNDDDINSPQPHLNHQQHQDNKTFSSAVASNKSTLYNHHKNDGIVPRSRQSPIVLAEDSDDYDDIDYGVVGRHTDRTRSGVTVHGGDNKYIVETTKTIQYLEDPYNEEDVDDHSAPRVSDGYDNTDRDAKIIAAAASMGIVQDSFEEIEVGPRFRDPSNDSLDPSSYTPPPPQRGQQSSMNNGNNDVPVETTPKSKDTKRRKSLSLAESFIKRKNSASSYFFSNKNKDKATSTGALASANNGAVGGGGSGVNKKSSSLNSSPSSTGKNSSNRGGGVTNSKKEGTLIVDSPSSKKALKNSKRASPKQRFDDIRTTGNREDDMTDNAVTGGGPEEPALVVPQPPSSRRKSAKTDGR